MPESRTASLTIFADREAHTVTVSGILGDTGESQEHTLRTQRAALAITTLVAKIFAIANADAAVEQVAAELGIDLADLSL